MIDSVETDLRSGKHYSLRLQVLRVQTGAPPRKVIDCPKTTILIAEQNASLYRTDVEGGREQQL